MFLHPTRSLASDPRKLPTRMTDEQQPGYPSESAQRPGPSAGWSPAPWVESGMSRPGARSSGLIPPAHAAPIALRDDFIRAQAERIAQQHYLASVPGASQGSQFVTRLDIVLRSDPFAPESIDTLNVIQTWLDYKRKWEVDAIRLRPHPYEFHLYYDI